MIFGTCNRCKQLIMYYVGKKQNWCTKAETGLKVKLMEELVWFSFVYFFCFLGLRFFASIGFPFRETDVAQNFYGQPERRRRFPSCVCVAATGGASQ